MPDDTKTGTGVTDTKKTDTSQTAFDLSKVGDEDFNKIFDDPRLWKHPRFKDLNDRAKEAAELKAAQQAEKEKKLLEEKKYQELVGEKDKTIAALNEKLKSSSLNSVIVAEASKAGAVDTEAVLKLVDRANVKINDDGTVTGVAEAVKSLLDSKSYLKGTGGSVKVGDDGNPGTDVTGKYKFKMSQLQDASFFTAHEKEIMEAQKAGQIENDLR